METREEIIDLSDGRSYIDVRGGAFDSLLLFDGKPIAMNWNDCEGSVAQYLARAGRVDCESHLGALRRLLEGHFDAEVPISSQIYVFLQLLSPGRYRLTYCPESPNCDYCHFNDSWKFSTDYAGFYPFGETFVLTQPTDSLDQDRITHFERLIQKGLRPIALTAKVENGWCDFVLDGHHKLQAYKRSNVNPAFISICRLDAPRISPDTFDAHFDPRHPKASHYRKVKGQFDR